MDHGAISPSLMVLLDLCELAVQQQDNLDNSLLLRQYEEGEDQMHDDEELRIHSSMKYFQ